MKKLLLIVIDSWTARLLEPAMSQDKLPNFQTLVKVGSMALDCVSIFPSITHAATSSIATGRYPQEHGIPGTHWYNAEDEVIVYHAPDLPMILNKGMAEFFKDFIRLNHRWLQAKTIFQILEKAGFRAACINHLIFRGDVPHDIHIPPLLELLPVVPKFEKIYGPSMLYMGDFINTSPETREKPANGRGGLLNRFGFEDDNTIDVLTELVADRALPDFTLAYFPDNDDYGHRLGPEESVFVLENLDKRLGDLFFAYGGLDELLQEFCLILTGDHSQSDVMADEEAASIWLNELLSDFSLAQAGETWSDQEQMIICPNLRMAQIYFKIPARIHYVESVVKQLLTEPGIDQVIWRAELTDKDRPGYQVATANRGELNFWPDKDGLTTATDHYGCPWSWEGDLSTVDGQVTEDGVVTFPDYPNAFERIAAGLNCSSAGQLWVTARPGYEFRVAEISIHTSGGSHGSLHALDSLAPLIVAGAPDGIRLPAHPRIVDITPLCLSAFELKPPHPVGASHISGSV